MIVKSKLCAPLLAALLCGCSATTQQLMDGPDLSPVGSGLRTTADDVETGSTAPAAAPPTAWIGGPADYFRDARAHRVGDLISVRIGINDNANFANTTDRSRKASTNGTANFNLGLLGLSGAGAGNGSASDDSASSGQGTITRSEKLNLSLTVVVRQVYANGNMLVAGSQEVLVNMEKRVVHVSGIIDPRFIAPDNSIEYSKIAEARVSYGGNGKITDATKTRWGVQLWDKINPF